MVKGQIANVDVCVGGLTEQEARRGGQVPHRPHSCIVRVEDRNPVARKRDDQLRFRSGNSVDATYAIAVSLGHAGDDSDVG